MLPDLTGSEPTPRLESCERSCALAFSSTCRLLRWQIAPWIFDHLYNWNRGTQNVWPKSLWSYPTKLEIRDRSVRHPAQLLVNHSLALAIESMQHLRTVTIRLETAIPTYLLVALSNCRALADLTLQQARLDGEDVPTQLVFPALETLIIRFGGIWGVLRDPAAPHDVAQEHRNVHRLLHMVSPRLKHLTLSGDYISLSFTEVIWTQLVSFTVTEHPPRPHITVPDLIVNMPYLRTLELCFTPNNAVQEYPPFRTGWQGHNWPPNLTSLSLSNVDWHEDSIFAAIPGGLKQLRLLAEHDLYDRTAPHRPNIGFQLLEEYPVKGFGLLTVLPRIPDLSALTSLSVTLGEDTPSSDLLYAIENKCPSLRDLQVRYVASERWRLLYTIDLDKLDTRSLFFLAFRKFQHLTHVTFFIVDHPFDHILGAPAHSAYRLLSEAPRLQLVTYKFGGYYNLGSFAPVVYAWDRALLDGPPPPRSIRHSSARLIVVPMPVA
ncbi:hypothetical protein MIND_00288400 [Mycena indigotica]|uniref:F-box domain-containing protein n=1 Tax=Mycena indigotica TaxID=2126181 RepID=A0A8H6T890_9AGAR|nr:uncharacterized protein MIND_00288400 [Mycena indigotica]KAF7312735.1 hypothetical protein MIND_00288400 [Mycena indigotica]